MDHAEEIRDFWKANFVPIILHFQQWYSSYKKVNNTDRLPYTYCEIVFATLYYESRMYSERELSFDQHVTRDLQIILRMLQTPADTEENRLQRLGRTMERLFVQLQNYQEISPDEQGTIWVWTSFKPETVKEMLYWPVASHYRKFGDIHESEHDAWKERFQTEQNIDRFLEGAENFFKERNKEEQPTRGETIIAEALKVITDRDSAESREWYAKAPDREAAQKAADLSVRAEQRRQRENAEKERRASNRAFFERAAAMLRQEHPHPTSSVQHASGDAASMQEASIAPSSNPYIVAAQLSAFVLRD